MPEPVRLAMSLVGIVVIIAGAYYTTYYIGLKGSGQSSGINRAAGRGRVRNIVLLERFAISKDKSFCIVEIAGKIYVIGVTNQAMTVIDTIDALEFAEAAAACDGEAPRNMPPGGPFSGVFISKIASIMSQKMGRPNKAAENREAKGESFADSMKSARERSVSGQPDRGGTGRPNGSEEEE